MPLFRADIQKEFNGEYWTNRYFVNAASLAVAVEAGLRFVGRERAITNSRISFDKLRVDDNMPNTDIYSITTLGGVGGRVNGSELLPLFNVVRVDFNAATGRPSRKFLRGVLIESETVQFDISQMVVDFVLLDYAGLMVSDAAFVDIDGQAFTGAAVNRRIGMRQLRRGSKRRLNPVI